jgi:nucleotide-binding universal stress UspA family protein
MFQQIFVMWDGSELAERAFDLASDMAAVYDADVTAVCVVERPHTQHRALPHLPHHDEEHPRAGHTLASANKAQALFAEKHVTTDPESSHCQLEVIYGHDVAADLLHLAHEHAADLIVVGHHCHASTQHLLPHGLTERLMLSAEIPLLVVGG